MPNVTHEHAQVIAESFELAVVDVVADELAMQQWTQPTDDLVVWLADRHKWDAEYVVHYLTALHTQA